MTKVEKEIAIGREQQQNKTELPINEDNKKVKNDKEYPYYVILNDAWGTASKQQVKVPVARYIEKSNVYLYNEKIGFKEEMPEDTEEYKQYKLEELTKKIISTEDKIRNKNSNDSVKDLKEDLRILKSWKRSIELQGRGSYMNFDIDGKPFFEFDRRGMFRLPVFKNVDISLKYVPDESKIKEASDLIIENNKANGENDNLMKFINVALAIILCLTIVAFGYFTYQTNLITGDIGTNLVDITKNVGDISSTLSDNTKDLLNITEQLNTTIEQPPSKNVNVNPINQ